MKLISLTISILVSLALGLRDYPYTSWRVGNPHNVKVPIKDGTLLMGGSPYNIEGFKWMINRIKGGDFLVLTSTGDNSLNSLIYDSIGGVNSCETILVDTQLVANIRGVYEKV